MPNNNTITDVFTSPYNAAAQIWQTQGAKIYWCNAGGQIKTENASALVCLTAFRATLTRQVLDRYPLGGGGIIRLVGQPHGEMTIQSLLGPSNDVATFIAAISSLCNPIDVVIMPFALSSVACGTDNTKDVQWRFTNCTSTQVQFDIQQAQGGLSLVTIPITARFDNAKINGVTVNQGKNKDKDKPKTT